jgi:hypothetical protein
MVLTGTHAVSLTVWPAELHKARAHEAWMVLMIMHGHEAGDVIKGVPGKSRR